jgi:hypothetical protein
MWLGLIRLIGGPIVTALIDAYRAKLVAQNTTEKIAADLAASEVASSVQLRIAQVGHPWEPEKIAMYIVLVYMGKVMLYDASFHLGSTDTVNGAVGIWAGLVVSFYFGTATIRKMLR